MIDSITQRQFAERVGKVLQDVRPDISVDHAKFFACVDNNFDIGKAAGFETEADLGLYCIACFLDPKVMENGDLGAMTLERSLPVAERRYRLKAALDDAGHLAFGAHEAVAGDPIVPADTGST